MATAHANGVSIEYRESGSGDPVVFVHGGLSDHRTWEVHREALGAKYRSIAYSCRYHWPNPPAPQDALHSVSDQVDDLRALVRTLDAAPAHLVGNSFGGLLCILAAIQEPSLVRSLVLLEPFSLPLLTSVPPKPFELLKLGARHPGSAAAIVLFGVRGLGPSQAAFERGDLERGQQLFTRAVLGPRGVDRMTAARREQARDNLEVFASQLTRGTFPSVTGDDVRRLTIPTLLLGGDESPAIMRHLNDRLQDMLPHADRVAISGASHDSHLDNPSGVAAAMLSFLDRQSSTQPSVPDPPNHRE